MPFDSHCGAAPPIFNTDCDSAHATLVNDGATALREASKKFVPHVSPYVSIPGWIDWGLLPSHNLRVK